MNDSVPAPMVLPRTPGSVVEATHRDQRGLWMLTPLRDWVMSDINNTAVLAATEGLTVHRVLFDAATPAASVPAADILALADEWERMAGVSVTGERFNADKDAGITAGLETCVRDLRALVAAAEQADKGETADTPRDDEQGWAEDRAGHAWDTSAPAAPVGEPPRCMHASLWGVVAACGCQIVPARVPVNDEAEGCETFECELDAYIAESMKDPEYAEHHHWIEYRETHAIPFWDRHGITEATFKAGFRAARGEDDHG